MEAQPEYEQSEHEQEESDAYYYSCKMCRTELFTNEDLEEHQKFQQRFGARKAAVSN